MGDKEIYLLGYSAIYSAGSQPMFQRKASSQLSGLKIKPRKKTRKKQAVNKTLFSACLMSVSCLAYTSTLNVETCCSETSFDFQRIMDNTF